MSNGREVWGEHESDHHEIVVALVERDSAAAQQVTVYLQPDHQPCCGGTVATVSQRRSIPGTSTSTASTRAVPSKLLAIRSMSVSAATR